MYGHVAVVGVDVNCCCFCLFVHEIYGRIAKIQIWLIYNIDDVHFSVLSYLQVKPEQTKVESKTDSLAESLPDTTDRHGQHLFDANCKICTGVIVPGVDTTPSKSQVGTL